MRTSPDRWARVSALVVRLQACVAANTKLDSVGETPRAAILVREQIADLEAMVDAETSRLTVEILHAELHEMTAQGKRWSDKRGVRRAS